MLGRRMIQGSLTTTLFLCLSLASLAAASDPVEEGRASVHALRQAEHLPGIAVAVMRDGELLWSEAFGYANLEHLVPATPRTRFRVGSISKALTSAALGLLLESGQLDLDAPVQDYVPEFPDKGHPISTRQLAGHLSGIPHYNAADIVNRVHYDDVIHALDKFKDRPLLFVPGERYSYSSFGWNLIAAVVERASETPFLTFLQERVFEPAGMVDTIADHYAQIIPNRTSFYGVENGRVGNAPGVDNSDVWAAGGFLSTPEDLVRFGSAMLDGTLVEEDTLALLCRPLTTTSGEDTGYGLGWGVRPVEGHATVGHGGSHIGATAQLLIFPEADLVVALITNANSRGLGDLTRKVGLRFLRGPCP